MADSKTAARRWADLRPREREAAPTEKVLKAALQKIKKTPEGRVLFGFLDAYDDRVPGSDATDGALREHTGARRLIAQIRALAANDDHVG